MVEHCRTCERWNERSFRPMLMRYALFSKAKSESILRRHSSAAQLMTLPGGPPQYAGRRRVSFPQPDRHVATITCCSGLPAEIMTAPSMRKFSCQVQTD